MTTSLPRRALSHLRLADWPRLDDKALSEEARAKFRQRCKAVEAYAKGEPVESIERSFGVARATTRRLIARALRAHADGRLWGYRALVPHERVADYERLKAPRILVRGKAGNAGVFSQLLQRHPDLAAQLREELRAGRVTLRPGEKPRLKGVKAAAQRFQVACRKLGLSAGDYPLNQEDKAVRSLARTLLAWLQDDFDLAAHAAGSRIKPASALRQLPERGASEAFDTVEFDAHKVDLRLKVVDRDPFGIEHSFETERVWLLAIIDVTTRCILGHQLCLQRECNRFDVIETFRRAVMPAGVPRITLPGLRLLPAGGFVSQALEQTHWACWRQVRLDNARAHVATTSLDVLCESLGCVADFGPSYQPDDRPFIERFFGTVGAALSHRLPGSLSPRAGGRAAVKRLRESGAAGLALIVTAQELQELLDVTVWNYHGTPHAGLGGSTPLEMMQRHVLGIGREPVRPRLIPAVLREHPELLQDPVLCHVRGNLGRGERPYVSFFHVRYTSEQLTRRSALIGRKLRVRFDPMDLRRLQVTTEKGDLLDDLWASGPWRHEPHSLRVRQQVFAAKRRRQLEVGEGENPIDAFLALRRKEAGKRRRAASDLAQVQHDRAMAKPSQVPEDRASPTPKLVTGPIKGNELRIKRGYTR
jgi:hypothetical protein